MSQWANEPGGESSKTRGESARGRKSQTPCRTMCNVAYTKVSQIVE